MGRKDDQIKRWGVITYLSDIESAAKKVGFLNCACISDYYQEEVKIGLFIFSENDVDLNFVRTKLRKELKSSSWPDNIFWVKNIPLTSHGNNLTLIALNLVFIICNKQFVFQ